MSSSKDRLHNLLHMLPVATITIIVVNVIVTLLTRHDFESAAMDYGLIASQLRIGRFVSSGFLHDGFVHLGLNMFILYLFGSSLERAIGKLEFVLFYVGSCFAASLLQVAVVSSSLDPYYADRVVVGASGAVAGVMGLYAVRFHRKMFKMAGLEISALFLILCWLMMQVGLGILALYRDNFIGLNLRYVAYWSHLGGFTFGIVVALLSNTALQGEREYLTSEGKRNYDIGNLLEAAHNYESLIKYDPDNASAHAELGRLWAIMEEADQSLPYYRKALKLYIREGSENKAMATAEEMKRFWPEFSLSPAKRFRLASYLEEVGKPEQAVAMFQEIADTCPTSIEAQMSLLKIGQLQLAALKDPASATNTLTIFLQRYPNNEWQLFAEETLTRAKETAFQSGTA